MEDGLSVDKGTKDCPGATTARAERKSRHTGYLYRAPRDLRRSPFKPKRVLVVGACLSEPIAGYINRTGFNSAEYVAFNNFAPLPSKSKEEIDGFDFQIVQIPLRSLMPEGGYVRLKYHDIAGYQDIFNEAKYKMKIMFDNVMIYNKKFEILTFVQNFLSSQQNPMGRLLPKYDLRNPVYFIYELNRFLFELISSHKNSFLLDIDEIAATHGRRFYQDDSLWLLNHGSVLDHYDHPFDQDRIEPPTPIYDYYEIRNEEYRAAVWHETEALYESIRQVDSVKMVVIDLDDTLWRGELVEQGVIPDVMIEGWPLGFIEALSFLKRRGVILGIISKNTESTIAPLWDGAVAGLLKLEDFAIRRINWAPKPDNMREILDEANLLPSNVVYVDDNPLQRAIMLENFPDLRVLGEDIYYNRRILLWSPETQGAIISDESSSRTEMIRAQVGREDHRKMVSAESFLAELDLTVEMQQLFDDENVSFARCYELLNKSNQFNTTGRRWNVAEIREFFRTGGKIHYASAGDRFTKYGIILVALIQGRRISQMVMSCRVIGLGVEAAALSAICAAINALGPGAIMGLSRETPNNLLSRDLFARGGFHCETDGERWWRDGAAPEAPAHVRLVSKL